MTSNVKDKAQGVLHAVKEKLPGTTEHKLAQSDAGYGTTTAGTHGTHGTHGSSYSTGQVDNQGLTGQHQHHGHAHGTATGLSSTPGYTGQVDGTQGLTGQHHGHHEGHHHGHQGHGHHATGASVGTGATTDTPHQSTYEGVAKFVPGTDAHGVHQANQGTGGGYGTGTGTGYDNSSTVGNTGTGGGYGTGTGGSYGTGTGAHTGHHHSAGNVGSAGVGAATGGTFGSSVDTHQQTTTEGIKKHLPGTDEHDVHSANREAGRGDNAGGYGATHGVKGAVGQATGGLAGSTVDTPHETTKEKIAKHIPGTEANKAHKANKDLGTA